MSELLLLGFLGLIGFLVTLLVIMTHLQHNKPPSPYPPSPYPPSPLPPRIIGGCSGTQYGCCADGRTQNVIELVLIVYCID